MVLQNRHKDVVKIQEITTTTAISTDQAWQVMSSFVRSEDVKLQEHPHLESGHVLDDLRNVAMTLVSKDRDSIEAQQALFATVDSIDDAASIQDAADDNVSLENDAIVKQETESTAVKQEPAVAQNEAASSTTPLSRKEEKRKRKAEKENKRAAKRARKEEKKAKKEAKRIKKEK